MAAAGLLGGGVYQDILAALAQIEQRQIAYEAVAHQIFETLAVHTEMLQAIREAATADPGPSPVIEASTA